MAHIHTREIKKKCNKVSRWINVFDKGRGCEQGCDREPNHFFCLELVILNYFFSIVHSKSISLELQKKTCTKQRDNANVSTISGKFSNEN